MSKKFNLSIVTPKKLFLSEEIEILNLNVSEGRIGLLINHVPFISKIKISDFSFERNGEKIFGYLLGGIIYMDGKKATIITRKAILKEEVDKNVSKGKINSIEKQLKDSNLTKEKIDLLNKKLLFYQKQL